MTEMTDAIENDQETGAIPIDNFGGTVDPDGVSVWWNDKNNQRAGVALVQGEGAAEAATMLATSPFVMRLMQDIVAKEFEPGDEAKALEEIRKAAGDMLQVINEKVEQTRNRYEAKQMQSKLGGEKITRGRAVSRVLGAVVPSSLNLH